MDRKIKHLRILGKLTVEKLKESLGRVSLTCKHGATHACEPYTPLKILFFDLRFRLFQQRQCLFAMAGLRHRQRTFRRRCAVTDHLDRGLSDRTSGKETKNKKARN